MDATLTFEGTVVAPGNQVRLKPGHVLPAGTEVVVSLQPGPAQRRGSPAAILEMLRSRPRVAHEDVEELRRVISEGRGDSDWRDPFLHGGDGEEQRT